MKRTITWVAIALLLYGCKPDDKVSPKKTPQTPTGSVEIIVKGTDKSVPVSYYHPVLSKTIVQYTDKDGKIRIDGLVEALGLHTIDVGDSCQSNSYCINYTKYINPKANQVLQQVQYVYQRRIIKVVTNTSPHTLLWLEKHLDDINGVSMISDSMAIQMYKERELKEFRHDAKKWLYETYLPIGQVRFRILDSTLTSYYTSSYKIQENMCQDTLVYVLN